MKTGIVDGPQPKGKVLEYSRADWALVRPDSVVGRNARYLLQADDGTLIYIRSLGYVYGAGIPITRSFAATPFFEIQK